MASGCDIVMYRRIFLLLFVWTAVAAGSSTTGSSSQPPESAVVASVDLRHESPRLLHLRLSPDTRHVFVGGVNRLFQLSDRLRLLETVVTGPQQDSPSCPASGCSPDTVTSSTDNFNKVLVVDAPARTLLTCGSLRQGSCHKFELTNISWPSQSLAVPVAANDPEASTVAFIGPEHYSAWMPNARALYVAATFTLVGDYRNSVPAVSTRSLHDLRLQQHSITQHSKMTIDVRYRDHFLVDYVYGFNTSSHVYFVTVQRRTHLPGQQDAGYVSRVGRVCVTDANYDSYVEMTLQCGRHGALVQAAHLARAGASLASSPLLEGDSHVLLAAFSPSATRDSRRPQETSSVCVFPIAAIDRMFDENIHMCYNGSMLYRNMEYISGPILNGKCPQAGTSGNIQNFCSRGLKLSARYAFNQSQSVDVSSARVTSVVFSSVGHHSVALLGTADGTLLKYLVLPSLKMVAFGEAVVERGAAVLADAAVDPRDNRFWYGLTARQVLMVDVAGCDHFSNCSSCVGSRNPYCGWCTLESRCSLQSECAGGGVAELMSQRWLTFDNRRQQCVAISGVVPSSAPLRRDIEVRVEVLGLPALSAAGGHYQCVLGSAAPNTASVIVFTSHSSILRCPLPPPEHRPQLPPSPAGHVLASLSVRSSATHSNVVSTSFVLYECARYASCGACVRAGWPCDWCVMDGTCVDQAATRACSGVVVSSSRRSGNSSLTAAELGCPSVLATPSQLVIASGVTSNVSLAVANLPPSGPLLSSHFTCVTQVEQRSLTARAHVISDSLVMCQSLKYEYQASAATMNVNVTLIWRSRHVIGARIVTLYKCGALAFHSGGHDCSLCLSQAPVYKCDWCEGQCRYAGEGVASDQTGTQCARWHGSSARTCPRPRIDKIEPQSGPVEGGTLLTIHGQNLGVSRAEVSSRVLVGSVPCLVVDYDVSVRVVCRTAVAPTRGPRHVQITTNSGHAQSSDTFNYLEVGVMGVYPTYGPVSGGTTVTVIGSHLTSGSNLSVMLGGRPCHVVSRATNVTCVTSAATTVGVVTRLAVQLDKAHKNTLITFSYRPDPIVYNIRPMKSFMSGGRLLSVHGLHLDSVMTATMFVSRNNSRPPLNSTTCRIISNQLMECASPSVMGDEAVSLDGTGAVVSAARTGTTAATPSLLTATVPSLPRHSTSLRLQAGFVMDGVVSVRQIRRYFPSVDSHVQYVTDPVVFPFPLDTKLLRGRSLVIEGRDLTSACELSEVRVTIGAVNCNVTSLTTSRITCMPSADLDMTSLSSPAILVSLAHVHFSAGRLQYSSSHALIMDGSVMAGVVGGCLFLLLLAASMVLLVYRRRSSRVEREYKRIQIQMDTLENKIRSECKQSFATMCTWQPQRSREPLLPSAACNPSTNTAAAPDVRTQLNNMVNQFSAEEVLCVDQREFLKKVLFPGVSDHPIFQQHCDQYSSVCAYECSDSSLSALDQLMKHDQFVELFVDTLEKQKDFNVRDRVTVASLLSVVTMYDMQYATHILHVLLSKHISRVSHNKQPQLMLRRTETVVEKLLTNWISLCLYDYIETRLCAPLHLLVRAIKCQMCAGPVDVVTQHAHFSVSEERLLHHRVDFSQVTLLVTADELACDAGACEDGACRHYEHVVRRATVHALSCDAVSQAKHKIIGQVYSGVPASCRPSHHSFMLVWQRGDGRRVMLNDEDSSSRSENGWRQVNTLHHYGITSLATVSLVHVRDSLHLSGYLPSSSSGFSVPSSCSLFSPCSSSNIYVRPGSEPRVFHLVRPASLSPQHHHYTRKCSTLPEIFLNRQLSNKAMLQWFVDNMMETFFTVDDNFPVLIKWLFDTLDTEARHRVVDSEQVLHCWKANCLPLRLWANLVRRPELIFDVDKSAAVDSTLAVISQSLVEACLPSCADVCDDSPPHRLLFAKDVSRWRPLVAESFASVGRLPAVCEQKVAAQLSELSSRLAGMFNRRAALGELLVYLVKYRQQLHQALASSRADNTNCSTQLLNWLNDALGS